MTVIKNYFINILLIISCLGNAAFVNAQQTFDFDRKAVHQRITEDVKVLSHDSLQGRLPGTPYEIIARDYIAAQFAEAGLSPLGEANEYYEAFWIRRQQRPYYNVYGFLDNNAAKTIVIGAHYDHLGAKKQNGDMPSSEDIFNGADDNASGVTAMLELSRYLSSKDDLNYNYLFIAFGAEEKGLLGSRFFVEMSYVEKMNIVCMINFDMIGRLGAYRNKVIVFGTATSPDLRRLVRRNKPEDLNIRRIGYAPGFSDHAPFYRSNVPYLYFTTGIHKDYHTPFDEFEKLNIDGMTDIVIYAKDLTKKLDNKEIIRFSQASLYRKIGGTIFSLMIMF